MEYQKREIKNLIMRIFDLAFRLNSAPTEKETTGDRPTAFVDFYGHTAGIDVRICPHGWREDIYAFEEYSYYLASKWDTPDALYNAAERLEELYSEWGDLDDEENEGGKHDEKREIKNLIMRIFDLAFRLNSAPTEKETTGDRPTAFVLFYGHSYGHTAGIDVRIYPHGWDLNSCEYETYIYYLASKWDTPDALYNAAERLEELYSEWGDLDENEDDEGGKHDE